MCREDGDCYDVASSCVQSTCVCPDGMKPNPDGTVCQLQTPLFHLNVTCDSSYQCGGMRFRNQIEEGFKIILGLGLQWLISLLSLNCNSYSTLLQIKLSVV